MSFISNIYYSIKPLLPRWVQLWLRRNMVLIKQQYVSDIWPILEQAGSTPKNWEGWPEEKKFSVVLTHDIETQLGHNRSWKVLEIERKLGFKSSFNFVPERYEVSSILRDKITTAGFEVGVHGLNHDGKLFRSEKIFLERAAKINEYIEKWDVVGFRAPAMHHNLDWIHKLKIDYDSSTFDTDPFEPQSDGVKTIFPFWVPKNGTEHGYVELPYTLAQDFTHFVLMRKKNIKIWKDKVDWIAKKGGMVLVNTHPDYFGFEKKQLGMQEFPAHFYTDLLEYIKNTYRGSYWLALPREVAAFWKEKMVNNCLNLNENRPV